MVVTWCLFGSRVLFSASNRPGDLPWCAKGCFPRRSLRRAARGTSLEHSVGQRPCAWNVAKANRVAWPRPPAACVADSLGCTAPLQSSQPTAWSPRTAPLRKTWADLHRSGSNDRRLALASPSSACFHHKGAGSHVHFCPCPCLSTHRWAKPKKSTDAVDHTHVQSVLTCPLWPRGNRMCVVAERRACLHWLALAAGRGHFVGASTTWRAIHNTLEVKKWATISPPNRLPSVSGHNASFTRRRATTAKS